MGMFDGVKKAVKNKNNGSSSSSKNTSNGTPATITNKDGSRQDGYISGGKTYYSDGSRIGNGATTIDSSGREWRMENGQGVATGNNYGIGGNQGAYRPSSGGSSVEYDSVASAYEKRQSEILRRQQEALRLRVDQGVNNLENQKGTVNAGFDDASRQAYIMKMQNQKALPEQMAAMGQTGGATETSNLAIGTNYQNNLTDINNNRTQAINGIDSAINNVRIDGNIEAANLEAANAQMGLETYMQMMQNKMSMEQQSNSNMKNDFINTIGAYANDFQAEINRIQRAVAAGDSSEAWKVPFLNSSRNEKISGQQSAAAEAEQQELENYLKMQNLGLKQQQVNYQVSKPHYKPASGGINSTAWNQAYKLWAAGQSNPWILKALGIQ